VDDDSVRHEIIRFRREEIADLGAMPSAVGQPEMLVQGHPPRRLWRFGLYAIASCALLVGALWLAVTLIGSSGFASDQLRARVESALHKAIGPDLEGRIGPARLTLSGAELLALDLKGFTLVRTGEGSNVLEADHLAFGLRLWPLLFGDVELASARISGARISVDRMGNGGPGWMARVTNDRGLIDPDRLAPEIFAGLDQFVGAMRRGASSEIRLQDIVLEAGQPAAPLLTLKDVTIVRTASAYALDGAVELAGTVYAIGGTLDVEQGSDKAAAFALTAENQKPDKGDNPGSVALSFSGDRAQAGKPPKVQASFVASQRSLDLGKRGIVTGDVDILARVTEGEGKVEIERANIVTGRSQFLFNGAIAPLAGGAEPAAYKFELVTNDTVIAPEESSEEALPALIRVAGTYAPGSRTLEVPELKVRASTGEASGNARFVFAPGQSPAMALDVKLAGMSVAQVKQLWPWMAAGSARRWVMQKFFGGTVREGSVRYDVAAGRLDDNIPLSADEVSGRFAIEGSRFDTAGVLPPVRDAVGAVSFRGNRVEISLDRGNAYMNSGRLIELSKGTLLIEDVAAKPLIGRMTMTMAGKADGMIEIAGTDPINALKGVDLAPEDLSGTVEGIVRADIPLQRGVDRAMLDWGVSLSYRDLALNKPFEGQRISNADGTIVLDPDKAVIEAKARLNDIPAELDLVQPLKASDVPVKRDIALVIDDKTRAEVAPGLNALVSGTIRVEVDARPGQDRRMEADLTQAKLDVPWAGWSKGAGVPAKASFVMAGTPGERQIRDFKLSGKSFAASGSITLAGSAFQSARFEKVSFNPQDDLAVSVKRLGKAYAVNVSGTALDGRALIKRLTDGKEEGGDKDSTAVTLSAEIGSVAGFGDETLQDVKLTYRGSASGGGSASIAARTASGAPVSMDNAQEAGQRRLSASAGDAGAILRFLNIYGRVEGGSLQLTLAGGNSLRGKLDVRNFYVVNEPKLASVVSTTPAGDNKSLNQAVKTNIDTSRVQFSRGFAEVDKGANSLKVKNAVLRGPVIGTTFEGTVFDANNQMDLDGTFMPAYGLNSIFGDIPVLGAFLGNGENGGLIGVTYRLRGDSKSPRLEVNPLSIMAPGIFRQIFEY
jgi:hypothetical protein